MILESLEVGSGVLTEHISDLVFIFIRRPEIANVGRMSLTHVI